DWPLFEYDEDTNRYVAAHHPFTAPKKEHEDMLETDPTNVEANAYDIVLNGFGLGGGSIRIHKSDLQETMFKALGFTDEEAQEQFAFLIEEIKYGATPHGATALGIDRLVMLLAVRTNLHDIIAF